MKNTPQSRLEQNRRGLLVKIASKFKIKLSCLAKLWTLDFTPIFIILFCCKRYLTLAVLNVKRCVARIAANTLPALYFFEKIERNV